MMTKLYGTDVSEKGEQYGANTCNHHLCHHPPVLCKGSLAIVYSHWHRRISLGDQFICLRKEMEYYET